MAARTSRFLIWGGGGHGKVVADLVRSCGHEVAGFIDADPAKFGSVVEPGGSRVIALEDDFRRTRTNDAPLPEAADAVVIAIGRNDLRFHALDVAGVRLAAALVHPNATVSPSATAEDGCVVLAGCVLNAGARLGPGVILNTGAVVEHDCQIDAAAHVSPGAVLAGGAQVGLRSWIGAGAVVIEGIRIGRDATVGAGAVVIRDVPDGTTVVGNPAQPLTG